MAIADWSTTAANNGTVLGVNIGENATAPSAVNNAIRQVCADVATGINFSVLGTFLSSTSLAQAQTALGVGSGSTSSNNFAALTNAANKMPLMTGSNNWTTVDAPSFGRSLLASGDANTALTLLGLSGGGSSSGTFGANSINISIPLGSGGTLLIKGGVGSMSGDSTATLSYGVTFAQAPVVIVCGGPSDTASEGSVHNYGTPGTSSCPIINTSGLTNSYTWVAVGKA